MPQGKDLPVLGPPVPIDHPTPQRPDSTHVYILSLTTPTQVLELSFAAPFAGNHECIASYKLESGKWRSHVYQSTPDRGHTKIAIQLTGKIERLVHKP